MTARFDRLATPAADATCPDVPPAAVTAPQSAAVSAVSTQPAVRPAGPPARIEDMGTVLTDRDLAALRQRAATWPRRERDRAKRLDVPPDLPVTMSQFRQPRYRKVDVEHWLRTGSRTRAPRLVRAS